MVPRGAVLNTLIDFDFFERVLILAQFPVSFMARSKKVENGHTARSLSPAAPSSPDKPTGPLSIVIAPEDREVIKVNNANVTELKNACDDAVKRVGFTLELLELNLNWISVPFPPRTIQPNTSPYRRPIGFGMGKCFRRWRHSVLRI